MISLHFITLWQHGGAVVSAAASQAGGPGFKRQVKFILYNPTSQMMSQTALRALTWPKALWDDKEKL